ncbi:putative F-box protein At3g25750 [Solanum pennellii]|uniref:F-box protein At3g25750 n=1 Tax=Solanum pennellii TaxID=28526 RepID=A0ABM1HEJ4_SOLPN|nr:putative F-box protein At3g25750 [Solanum pennellii]
MAGGWADLSMDLLAMIANRIESPKDFIFFTCVCTSWQIATTPEHKFDIFFTKTPLLMLADKHDDCREFYSLIKQKVTPLFLPEARQRHCCPSQGWLCTIDDTTGEMNLLHHLSRTQIQLPSRDNLMASNGLGDEVFWNLLEHAILSASPCVTSDYVLVVNYHANITRLAFWRPGDLSWTNIEMENSGAVMGINYYKGKFYYVTASGEFWVFQVPGPATPKPNAVEPHLLYWSEHDIFLQPSVQYYLVQLSDKLLFITRFAHHPELHRYKTYKFKVFEIDVVKGRRIKRGR